MLTGFPSKGFHSGEKNCCSRSKENRRQREEKGRPVLHVGIIVDDGGFQLRRSFSVITQKASSDSDSGSGSDKKGMDSDSEDEKPRPALSGSESQSGSKSESDSDPPPRKGPQARKNGLTSFHPLMIVNALL